MLKYREINCKSALNKIDNEYGFCYDLNIYRGCLHKCYYCFAVYSHKYINSKDFFGEIFVKKNIAEVLEKELSSRNWNRDIINLGSVTDNYQEAEKDYKLMRDVLKLLIRYKTPMCISTKSDLILRDFDLIDELSSIVPVRIASTITTLDEKLSSLIEPNVISPEKRFNMLREFKKTKAIVAVHAMPVMPFITEDSIEDIFKNMPFFKAFLNAQNGRNFSYLIISEAFSASVVAKLFAQALMCKDMCGKCENCQKIALGSHPDVKIFPENGRLLVEDSKKNLCRQKGHHHSKFGGRHRGGAKQTA